MMYLQQILYKEKIENCAFICNKSLRIAMLVVCGPSLVLPVGQQAGPKPGYCLFSRHNVVGFSMILATYLYLRIQPLITWSISLLWDLQR